MRVIAICTNLPELDRGGWRLPSVCAKYPGSGWCPYLDQYAAHAGIRVLSGSEALHALHSGWVAPRDIQVIQESANRQGQELVKLGARPSLLLCMESPIYDPHFYDAIEEHKARFQRSLLFSGGTDRMYFPAFDLEQIPEVVPWEERHATPIVCVMTNKHYAMNGRVASPSYAWAMETQLQDLRYETVEQLAGLNAIHLYGKHWPAPVSPIPDGEKVNVIRWYKFALCFENGRYPGYVTEKIIDCLVAGVVPIYLGAPDIAEHVPVEAFVPFTDAQGIVAGAALHDGSIVKYGQAFLRSPEGRRHSYQGFAERVMGMLVG